MVIALGIDPGLRATGYSVIQGDRTGCRLRGLGLVRASADDLLPRLEEIHRGVLDIIGEFEPDLVVVEDLFTHPTFPRTALLLAHVRGVIYLTAAQAALSVEALAPAAVKRALTGSGRASKAQVQAMVALLLSLKTLPDSHAADASALAMTALSRRGIPLKSSVARPVAGMPA